MAIIREIISGNTIINEINSSNLNRTIYDVETKKLIVEFKNGARYVYDNVPHQLYTSFRKAESHGKYFIKEISKNFKFTKL